MNNILIASWNSESEYDAISLEELIFDIIYICPSTNESRCFLSNFNNNRIRLFSTESPLYNKDCKGINNKSCDDIKAYEYFASDVCGLLQADRLILDETNITDIYLKSQELFFYWLNF